MTSNSPRSSLSLALARLAACDGARLRGFRLFPRLAGELASSLAAAVDGVCASGRPSAAALASSPSLGRGGLWGGQAQRGRAWTGCEDGRVGGAGA